jgi:hypothetical protein
MTLMTAANDIEARKLVATCSTKDLCDMYVNARLRQRSATGDEARAVSRTLGWIGEELESRDPDAARDWCAAEERIEVAMLHHDQWIEGASDVDPHPFFGIATPRV